MRAIERLGITKDIFKKMYEDNKGFNHRFNRNHPSHSEGEDFYSYINAGNRQIFTFHTLLAYFMH